MLTCEVEIESLVLVARESNIPYRDNIVFVNIGWEGVSGSEPSHPYIHEYMLLSGGKGKEVSGSLSPLPAESKVFVYKLVGVSGWGASLLPTQPIY